jgi:hypothetical protein
MNHLRFHAAAWIFIFIFAVCVLPSSAVTAEPNPDANLARARAYVEKHSDRYMHHSRLRRGMKGYGLSVFKGTKIEKFDVVIESVIEGRSPQLAVILAMCSGKNLEKTNVVHGMSGSPIYIKDPQDGKFKMVGALAYGFSAMPVEPLCGIQPITQMLAMSGALPAEKKKPEKKPKKTPATQPTSMPAAGGKATATRNVEEFLSIVLDPKRRDFSPLFRRQNEAAMCGQMQPLRIPVSVSGLSGRGLKELAQSFEPMGMVPLAGGGYGGMDAKQLRNVKLQPGSSLAIPMVSGDMNWAAIGTVTEVIGDYVLGFGHAMNVEGNVNFPMGTGYVHTIVGDQQGSFKMGSAIRSVGALTRDESVGVGGVLGQKVRGIPMTVHVNQVEDKRKQTFEYQLIHKRNYTPGLAGAVVNVSGRALRLPPQYHHIRYEVEIDFGKLGVFKTSNLGGFYQGWFGSGFDAATDVARPIAALMNNPFGPEPQVKGIKVNLTISKGDISATIIDFKLDGEIYKPGDTVTGTVLLERFRKKRLTLPVSFKLPENLPEGKYPLTVGDSMYILAQQMKEKPQDYQPRTVRRLFDALQRIAKPQADRLYLHMPLLKGGVALDQGELPELPSGKAAVLLEAKLPDTKVFRTSLTRGKKTEYHIYGHRTMTINVRKQTNETLLR